MAIKSTWVWTPICRSEEHGAGTSDVQSHQTRGSKSVAVCAREPERQTDTRASGLDSLIKAKCWLTPPHLQCHKLPTQPARPCLLSADNIHLLFQLIKYETRKRYFSSWVSASQHNTHSATVFFCLTWSRKLFDRPNLLCLFTVFTSLHFRSFTWQLHPRPRRQREMSGRSPQCIFTSMGSQSLSRGFTNEPLFSQKPNVSFYLCKPNR